MDVSYVLCICALLGLVGSCLTAEALWTTNTGGVINIRNGQPMQFPQATPGTCGEWTIPTSPPTLDPQVQEDIDAELCEKYWDCMRPHLQAFDKCSREHLAAGITIGAVECIVGCILAGIVSSGLTIPLCGLGCGIAASLIAGITWLSYRLTCVHPLQRARRDCYKRYPCLTVIPPE